MKVPVHLSTAFGKLFEERIQRFIWEKKLMPEGDALTSHRFLSRSVLPHLRKLSDRFNRLTEEATPEGEEVVLARHGRPRAKPATQAEGLDPYWKTGSRPENLRLAYFLYFMPPNLFRVAAVWSELARLGFRWPDGRKLKGIEFGAGPASGACGIAAGERYAPTGLPPDGNWALIEQDRAMLELGAKWAENYFNEGTPAVEASEDGTEPARDAERAFPWDVRTFHRTLTMDQPLLPAAAPRFNLMVMSYFLNESAESPALVARRLMATWTDHLEDEGMVILVEPALKLQSRKLLEIRAELLKLINGETSDVNGAEDEPTDAPTLAARSGMVAQSKRPDQDGEKWRARRPEREVARGRESGKTRTAKNSENSVRSKKSAAAEVAKMQILLPCLGHQACGALAKEDDWCHEEVSWWRPPYFRVLDQLAGLDRKTLPFSYLVLTKSSRRRETILPALGGTLADARFRLVSPGYSQGREREFFVCGTEGKRRARIKPESKEDDAAQLDRGDILLDAEIRGDVNASRVASVKKIL